MNQSLRWQLKKTARKGFALGHRLFLSRTPNRRIGDGAVRVLTYHRFGEVNHDPFCVAPKDFERQMSWLAQNRLAVSLREIEEYIHQGKSLRDGALLVTMDDGCSSVLTHALPILKHYQIPSVAFVTTGNIGRKTDQLNQQGEKPKEDYLDWEQLGRLSSEGVDIGSHALTHRSLTKMPIDDAKNEMFQSRKELEQKLGISVSSFAYPYGTLADFNLPLADSLRSTGYRLAFTSQHGMLRNNLDSMLLPRIKVEGGDADWLFPILARGGLDNWRWIDKAFWRMQASGRG